MVDTWRSPKAENSAERMPSIETPSVFARSRSIFSEACRARSCESLVTSRNSGSARICSCSFSAQSFSSSALTLCRMYWYCALLGRPPSCRFWIGCMKAWMPGTSRNLRRRLSTTFFIGSRSPRGFRLMNSRPVFCEPCRRR